MGWEDQGRQYHGWFGSGTSSGGDEAAPAWPVDIAAVVAAGAAAYLPAGLRGAYEAHLERGGGRDLVRAIPIWAASSALDAATFRARMVGPAMGLTAAESLQAMARLAAAPGGPGDVRAASAHLASALEAGGENWLYNLTYAKDMAVFAAANVTGTGDARQLKAGALVASVAVAGAPPAVGPLVVAGRAAAAALAAPVAALTAGALVLFWPRTVADATMSARGEGPLGGTVWEARRPKPSGRPEPNPNDEPRVGTHERPPTGSKPIDETAWSGDHRAIKEGVQAKPDDKVSISPDGEVWRQHPDGSWSTGGPAESYTGAGRAAGRTGKEREARPDESN